MRKTPSALGVALSALCLLGFFTLVANAQDRDHERERPKEHPNGIVQDWSHRYVVYPRFGPIQSLIAVQNDPRAIQSWQESIRKDWRRHERWRNPHRVSSSDMHPDWSISLGGGTVAPAMFPAKFTFDPGALPSCLADYTVFPVNAIGSSSQPNIVAFDNLYSGTTGGVGICNRGTPLGTDDGVSATLFWTYNVQGIPTGGQVATSPALSIDGTKVAFVETATGHAAHFHVLAWQSVDQTPATFTQNVGTPLTVTINSASPFSGVAPVAASGTATDLVLGSGEATLSSPFVDYNNDLAYVGNDSGVLFRIANVFCTLPSCTPGTSLAPSLDTSWPATGATAGTGTLNVCSGKLTGPVAGGSSGNIFVGCSDGKVYGFTPAGAAITGSPMTVGNGTATGGVVDPALLDNVNNLIYVVSGASGVSGPQVVVQASTQDLSSPVVATMAAGGNHNVHAPAFNDNYFTGGGTAFLYEVTGDSVADRLDLYGITFSGSPPVMTSGPVATVHQFPVVGAFEISPITTFLTAGGEDRLFESALSAFLGNMISANITSTFPTGIESFVTEGSGTSGIVVDNSASTTNQANSIYFGVLGANTAVKLTQSALQ